MVISIRRSQHEEGRNSLRFGVDLSMPPTIFFISRVSGRAGRAGSFLSPEAPLWVAVNERISRLGLCC